MLKYQQTTKRLTSETLLTKIKLADALYSERKYPQAIDILQELATKIDNSYTFDKSEVYRKLGNNYYALQDFDNAIIAYENTLLYYDNNASIYNMLGYMYFYKNSDKSIENYLKGMRLAPDLKNFVMLTQVMIKSKNYSQKDLKNTFEKYVDKFRPTLLGTKQPFSHNSKNYDKNKKLKIGYLSSDFYCHAMMSFVLPILENHDLNKFDITLYSCSPKTDMTTLRIKETGIKFEDCVQLSNAELADKIHNDGIDILIDLSGYTHNAIWSLLYKPAPIQMQYLGFLGTYGIKEVDYIIADEFTIPNDIAKDYTEKPLYINSGMNRFTFNTKNQKLPDIPISPYLRNKYITFGSFNCMSKINPYTISVWAKILKAVPTSKLLIYRTQMLERDILRLKKQFKENDIDETRLIFDNKPTKDSHFNSYPMCDIALDPLPFSGLTITIEQLHMGVPVLALAGETISAKGAARVCRACKLEDFVAETEAELIEKAADLASNPDKLIWYRNNLRNIMKNSTLCNDFKTYTQQLEEQYTQAWQTFCAN